MKCIALPEHFAGSMAVGTERRNGESRFRIHTQKSGNNGNLCICPGHFCNARHVKKVEFPAVFVELVGVDRATVSLAPGILSRCGRDKADTDKGVGDRFADLSDQFLHGTPDTLKCFIYILVVPGKYIVAAKLYDHKLRLFAIAVFLEKSIERVDPLPIFFNNEFI